MGETHLVIAIIWVVGFATLHPPYVSERVSREAAGPRTCVPVAIGFTRLLVLFSSSKSLLCGRPDQPSLPTPVSQPPSGIQEDQATRQAQVYEGEYMPLPRLRERKVGKEEQEQYQATHPPYPAREYQEYGEERHRSGQEKLGCLTSIQEEAEGSPAAVLKIKTMLPTSSVSWLTSADTRVVMPANGLARRLNRMATSLAQSPFPKGHL